MSLEQCTVGERLADPMPLSSMKLLGYKGNSGPSSTVTERDVEEIMVARSLRSTRTWVGHETVTVSNA